jgi:hypothetical protein
LEKVGKWNVGTIEHVTLALYTMIPPRRQQDYWKLWIGPNPPTGTTGTIDLVKKTIEVTDFKTVDKYQTFRKELPPTLIDTITKLRPEGWLFSKKDGLPYTSLSSFSDANNNVIKRALGNPNASVNTLRHAAASFVATDQYMLRGEKKQFATDMGHSLAMQGLYTQVRAAALTLASPNPRT